MDLFLKYSSMKFVITIIFCFMLSALSRLDLYSTRRPTPHFLLHTKVITYVMNVLELIIMLSLKSNIFFIIFNFFGNIFGTNPA